MQNHVQEYKQKNWLREFVMDSKIIDCRLVAPMAICTYLKEYLMQGDLPNITKPLTEKYFPFAHRTVNERGVQFNLIDQLVAEGYLLQDPHDTKGYYLSNKAKRLPKVETFIKNR